MMLSAMRTELKKQYGGNITWKLKVDKMSDRQVMAIYYRMLQAGKLKDPA